MKYEWRYPSEKPSYILAVGCNVHGDEDQRQAAKADVQKFLTPASIRQIEDWLAELSVITSGRSRDGIEAALTFSAYSSRLTKYAADVARAALLDRTWKWWPTWDELHSACEELSAPRRWMVHALGQPMPPAEQKTRPPTQAERDRIQAMVDEMFPSRSPEIRKAAVDEALKGNCMVETP